MIRSRVALGMCLAEGASLSTAETVPGESPTCAATDLSVTALPFVSAVLLICVMSTSCGSLAGPTQRYLEGGMGRPTMAFGASHYRATRTGRNYFRVSHRSPSGQEKARTRVLNLLETPERAATLACSDSIKTSSEELVNTSKPLRAAVFSWRNTF